jgi:hypothetical protein
MVLDLQHMLFLVITGMLSGFPLVQAMKNTRLPLVFGHRQDEEMTKHLL